MSFQCFEQEGLKSLRALSLSLSLFFLKFVRLSLILWFSMLKCFLMEGELFLARIRRSLHDRSMLEYMLESLELDLENC